MRKQLKITPKEDGIVRNGDHYDMYKQICDNYDNINILLVGQPGICAYYLQNMQVKKVNFGQDMHL